MKLQIIASLLVLCFSAGAETPNTLTDAEKKEGWILLFDGKSFEGWKPYKSAAFTGKGWSIEEGSLKNPKRGGRPTGGEGDIVTTRKFTNFDFSFEWKMSPGGNSGVKYLIFQRQGAPGDKMYAGDDGRSAVGHEYQLLDDSKHPDGKNGPIRQSGALYTLVSPNSAKMVKPIGEFNHSRIVVEGNHVEHWLNGAKILEYELNSKPLFDAVAKSKYKNVPGFGTKFATPILLQDHGDEVWFRNLKIRELPARSK